ncbi:MAG: tetratricopeptide repeat protein, partial [Spirochaetes bacterium]|nr:tetratricopeptide repeat protein [Spirochaetota bacterium]
MTRSPLAFALLLGFFTGLAAHADPVDDAARLFETGKVQEAFERVSAVLDKNPNQFSAQVLLFKVWLEKRLFTRAEESLAKILKARENEETWMLAAKYQLAIGDLGKAKAYALKVLDRNRRHVDALILLAQIEDLSGYPSRAAQSLREAGLVRDDYEPWLYQQGLFMLKQKRFPDLDAHLARYRKLFPESDRQFHLSSLRAVA